MTLYVNNTPIVESDDGLDHGWTQKDTRISLRVCRRFKRLYRMETDELLYPITGARILWCRLTNDALVQEWLA
jgi:hypothetical protein